MQITAGADHGWSKSQPMQTTAGANHGWNKSQLMQITAAATHSNYFLRESIMHGFPVYRFITTRQRASSCSCTQMHYRCASGTFWSGHNPSPCPLAPLTLRPDLFSRIRLSSVVLPEPRKPDSSVTGSRLSSDSTIFCLMLAGRPGWLRAALLVCGLLEEGLLPGFSPGLGLLVACLGLLLPLRLLLPLLGSLGCFLAVVAVTARGGCCFRPKGRGVVQQCRRQQGEWVSLVSLR